MCPKIARHVKTPHVIRERFHVVGGFTGLAHQLSAVTVSGPVLKYKKMSENTETFLLTRNKHNLILVSFFAVLVAPNGEI